MADLAADQAMPPADGSGLRARDGSSVRRRRWLRRPPPPPAAAAPAPRPRRPRPRRAPPRRPRRVPRLRNLSSRPPSEPVAEPADERRERAADGAARCGGRFGRRQQLPAPPLRMAGVDARQLLLTGNYRGEVQRQRAGGVGAGRRALPGARGRHRRREGRAADHAAHDQRRRDHRRGPGAAALRRGHQGPDATASRARRCCSTPDYVRARERPTCARRCPACRTPRASSCS